VSHALRQVKDVVKLARAAQAKWRESSFAERRSVLMDVMQYVVDHAEEIAKISIQESGKVRLEAISGEILPTCEKIRYICSAGEAALRDESRTVPALLFLKKASVRYFPLGVIGCIVPGNFPFHNAVSHITTALFSGNAAVVKVSEWGTLSRRFVQNMYNTILARRGHSADLVAVLPGYGDTGAALISSGVDKILFIGSPSTGQRVMKACAEHFVPVTLELGGKDPLVIFDDAEFEHAATICMRAVFWNCGQNCISAERIYVQSGVYDKFIAWATPRVKALRQGNALQGDFDLGAFGIPQQATLVDGLVQEAAGRGAKVLAGGKRNAATHPEGRFYEPTLLTDVTHDMEVVKKECFGPVMLVLKFETEQELIRGINSSDFALGASVFTTDYAKADRVARSIHSGMVSINEWGMSALVTSLPFGGSKLSGFGRFAGPEGLRDFCHVQAVVTDRLPIRTPQPTWLSYPLPAYAPDIMKRAIGILYAHGLRAKLEHVGKMLGIVKDIYLNGGKVKRE
jgi:acyl-CoA reductase-like NAD-dependent aldehyde dehydrogenase